MKKLLLSCALFFSSLAAAEGAKEALEQKLDALNTYQAEFKQTVTDAENTVIQQAEGLLQLQKPNQLRWELYAPNDTIVIADGDTVWHIDPFVEQVVAMNQSEAVQNNPLVLLAQRDPDTWAQFNVSRDDSDFVVASRSDDSHIAQLRIRFDDNTLSKLTMLDRQQQTSEFDFYNIQQNVLLEQGLFNYNLAKGYELDDQR
ncbi:Outer-membrane lipoprotein carrier protein [Saliniradius amylolyticus]|uniref:Outer-membrane lipoprotein carrier protein n=1 Tax=Saliniradius amylolyticus TaxID=2183582 RepID=A0A2S2E2Y6_9ALTE|nr:outer membrane lipoprotein chaperone LolA [Saliniradius amylolyticus]AWL12008.1 Outer-membrane lipoprotein carrier protein [Saliniradius amylolyticus]